MTPRNGAGKVTFKQPPDSAMESRSGICPKGRGGPHEWRLGRCRRCGLPEGTRFTSHIHARGNYVVDVSEGREVRWSVQMRD